jgi:hypothetical protein
MPAINKKRIRLAVLTVFAAFGFVLFYQDFLDDGCISGRPRFCNTNALFFLGAYLFLFILYPLFNLLFPNDKES